MALVQTMLRQNRIAICSFVRRENTSPRIVAAIPQVSTLTK